MKVDDFSLPAHSFKRHAARESFIVSFLSIQISPDAYQVSLHMCKELDAHGQTKCEAATWPDTYTSWSLIQAFRPHMTLQQKQHCPRKHFTEGNVKLAIGPEIATLTQNLIPAADLPDSHGRSSNVRIILAPARGPGRVSVIMSLRRDFGVLGCEMTNTQLT